MIIGKCLECGRKWKFTEPGRYLCYYCKRKRCTIIPQTIEQIEKNLCGRKRITLINALTKIYISNNGQLWLPKILHGKAFKIVLVEEEQ